MAWRELTDNYASRRKQITATGITATRVFETAWSSYMTDLITNGIYIGAPYPDGDCYVSTIDIVGFGKGLTGGTYDEAKITVNYSTGIATQQQEVGYEEDSIDFGGEMLTRDGGNFECGAECTKDIIGGVYYPRLTLVKTVTVDNIKLYISMLRSAVGHVNASAWNGAHPETVLLDGASARKFTNQNGKSRWAITFKFIYRHPYPNDLTWNKAWHGSCENGAKYEKVLFRKTLKTFNVGNVARIESAPTDTLYQTYDFSKLSEAFNALKSLRVR